MHLRDYLHKYDILWFDLANNHMARARLKASAKHTALNPRKVGYFPKLKQDTKSNIMYYLIRYGHPLEELPFQCDDLAKKAAIRAGRLDLLISMNLRFAKLDMENAIANGQLHIAKHINIYTADMVWRIYRAENAEVVQNFKKEYGFELTKLCRYAVKYEKQDLIAKEHPKQIMRYSLKYGKPFKPVFDKRTAKSAARYNNLKLFKMSFNPERQSGSYFLSYFAMYGNLKAVKYIHKHRPIASLIYGTYSIVIKKGYYHIIKWFAEKNVPLSEYDEIYEAANHSLKMLKLMMELYPDKKIPASYIRDSPCLDVVMWGLERNSHIVRYIQS